MKKILLASLLMGSIGAYAQTVKKVIVEDFTGLWCPHCPKGTVILDGLEASNPTNLIVIANHNYAWNPPSADQLTTTDGKTLADGLGTDNVGYPCGAIDRKKFSGETAIPVGRGQWTTYFNQRKAISAIVSVSIANRVKMPDGSYEADIKVNFSAAPASGVPLKLQVYLLEDSIPSAGSIVQYNAVDGPKSGASPLTTTTHKWYSNNTLRAAVGGAWGFSDAIPATPVVGTTYTKHIKFTIPDASTTPATIPAGGWKKDQVHIVAFVAYDGAAASDKKEILNAEEVALKGFFPTGVNEIEANTAILSVYPNPASVNDVIKMEYNIMENSEVTMKVYNISGQLVAQPFKSQEVAGSHTLQWRASEHNLPAGTYIMQLSTPNGMQSQKITLQ